MTTYDSDQYAPNPLTQYPILRFFEHDHLPPHLAAVSAPFHELAWKLVFGETHHPAERAVALRKLLEAKDAAVRAALLL